MGAPDPSQPPRLVGEVLGTGRIPDDLVGALLARFRITWQEGGLISEELSPRRGIHAFLGHLASGVDPTLGLERLNLLGAERDGTVHVFHLFFSIPVGTYATTRWLYVFSGDLPTEGPLL